MNFFKNITIGQIIVTLVLLAIFAYAAYFISSPNIRYSFFTGITEKKCIDGYTFLVNKSGSGSVSIVQIMDSNNTPVRCK